MMRERRWAMIVMVVLVMAPGASRAQTVVGRLLESGTGQPIAGGTMALLDTALLQVAQVFTDEDGRFRLAVPGPGAYYVRAHRVGYNRKTDGVLDLVDGGRIEITFYLRPEPVVLDSLVVTTERERSQRFLEDQGFYERAARGFGHFITPEDIERKRPVEIQDVLRGVPGLYRTKVAHVGTIVRFLNHSPSTGEAYCSPHVYIDGSRVPEPIRVNVNPVEGVRLEDYVSVESIAAVEIYDGPATIPVQWGGMGASCGVLVVWTKK